MGHPFFVLFLYSSGQGGSKVGDRPPALIISEYGLPRPFAELLTGRRRCLKILVEVVYISDGVGIGAQLGLFSHIYLRRVSNGFGDKLGKGTKGEKGKRKMRAVGPAKVKAAKQNSQEIHYRKKNCQRQSSPCPLFT